MYVAIKWPKDHGTRYLPQNLWYYSGIRSNECTLSVIFFVMSLLSLMGVNTFRNFILLNVVNYC